MIVDDIAAVVGSEIILSSEVKMLTIAAAGERNIAPGDTAAMRELSKEVLESEINKKVLLHHAKVAKIEVTDEEINQLVGNQLDELRKRYPNDAAFQRDLEAAGQTEAGLKEVYRLQATDELYRQKYLQDHNHEFPRVKVEEAEARKFFDQQPMGNSPEQVRFQYMVIAPHASEQVLAAAKTKIDSVYKQLLGGTDFAYLAEHFSDGPTASKGGDLGFFSKGEMVKEFEDAAFSMKVGEVRMVQTKFGWHLIRVEARRQKEVRARHILAATEVVEADWQRAYDLARSLRQRVLDGENFYTLAKENSEESTGLVESPAYSVLDNIQPEQFRVALRGEMTPVPGKTHRISGIIDMKPNGYGIVYELERKPAAPLAFEDVRQQIIERLQQSKAIEAYIDELRKKTYVEIRFEGWSPLAGGW
jgi:parvulin-like peptidyl-prolyl isomerase